MKKFLVLLICLASVSNSFACMNEYRTLLSGEVVYITPRSGKVWEREYDPQELRIKAQKLLTAFKRSDSIEYLSDYAATLTYLGKYQKAKIIYQKIEKRSPDRYTTASNLGTIYELIGKPDSALIWIKKSIELNPQSHMGSEWIHIKILEHKLSASKNLRSSILGLGFGSDDLPSNPNGYNLDQLSNQIWHQLGERTGFVKPLNKIVGNIYFDLGNLLAQTSDVQAALESYAAAKEYGFSSKLMDRRIAALEALAAKANRTESIEGFAKRNAPLLFWSVIAGVFLSGVLIIGFIRRRRNAKLNKS